MNDVARLILRDNSQGTHLVASFTFPDRLMMQRISSSRTYRAAASLLLESCAEAGPSRARAPFQQQARCYATHYDVLELPRTSSKREIKNKFYEVRKGRVSEAQCYLLTRAAVSLVV